MERRLPTPKPNKRYIWYDIMPDDQPVRCSGCGQFRRSEDCIYITELDGSNPTIIEKKCVSPGWFDVNQHGVPPKTRTAHRVWRTRPFKLHAVKPKSVKVKKSTKKEDNPEV